MLWGRGAQVLTYPEGATPYRGGGRTLVTLQLAAARRADRAGWSPCRRRVVRRPSACVTLRGSPSLGIKPTRGAAGSSWEAARGRGVLGFSEAWSLLPWSARAGVRGPHIPPPSALPSRPHPTLEKPAGARDRPPAALPPSSLPLKGQEPETLVSKPA